MKDKQVARGLGWFSLGLGATEAIAPNWFATTIGVEPQPKLMRSLGVREIAAGVGVLNQKNPALSLWARTAGDVMDFLVLATKMKSSIRKGRLALTLAFVFGAAVIDAIYARRFQAI